MGDRMPFHSDRVIKSTYHQEAIWNHNFNLIEWERMAILHYPCIVGWTLWTLYLSAHSLLCWKPPSTTATCSWFLGHEINQRRAEDQQKVQPEQLQIVCFITDKIVEHPGISSPPLSLPSFSVCVVLLCTISPGWGVNGRLISRAIYCFICASYKVH